MRANSTSSSSRISYISDIKKTLSLNEIDYLKNYNSDNLKHSSHEIQEDDKPTKLLDHQSIFSFDTNEENYVSNLYEDTATLMNELENMIFNLPSTNHLKENYEELKSNDAISFGTHNQSSYGFIGYYQNDIQNTEIFITTDRSIVGVATTLVHELQHHYDLNPNYAIAK
jgi:hypothetical protein